ncbi:MAG: aspartate racemase [Rhodobacteraceae bacterium]|nr:aspartate racemase [Paracoccaceae bacterium]
MHVGLIGGIGPAVTFRYYQRLFEIAREKKYALELTVVNCDMPQFLNNFLQNKNENQASIYADLANRLGKAGADFVVLPSIGGSFCLNEFIKISPLPVQDIMTPLRAHLDAYKGKTLGLIGTDKAMNTKIYDLTNEVDWLIPNGEEFDDVHNSYVVLATEGKANKKDSETLISAARKLIDRGAEAVVLGGTDLFLVFENHQLPFEIIDCADIHIRHVATLAAK